MIELSYTHIDSPVGSLMVAGDDGALHYLCFPNSPNAIAPQSDWHQTDAPFLEVRQQLAAYFNGELQQFDLPLFLTGTAFQKSVWRYLATIPFGETQSYGQLAAALERPKASRAVGAANGSNPLAIILPCHRVIGGDGSLHECCTLLADVPCSNQFSTAGVFLNAGRKKRSRSFLLRSTPVSYVVEKFVADRTIDSSIGIQCL